MARATRSSATHSHTPQPDPPTAARTKSQTKKRKRSSLPDNDDHQPLKQSRVKEENNPDIDDDTLTSPKLQNLQLVADVPIDPADAQHILDILELIDTQALLNRVFPLPPLDFSEPSTSKSQSGSFSLRALLREPSQHPLRVLRAAVQNLFPAEYHPRSRPSSPAAQQLRFCNLACSLLDQASSHSVPVPLDIDSLFDFPDASSITEPKSSPRPEKHVHLHQAKKFALVQRLPFGTWWSSLNSDFVPSDGKSLKHLSTANAELVAILPSPSAPAPAEPAEPEISTATLASYIPKKPPGHKAKLPGSRRISCGTFLDYGPYASFAPVFEQEGVEAGRFAMGELFWRWEDRKKRWSNERTPVTQPPSDPIVEPLQPNGVDKPVQNGMLEDHESLEGLFSKEQIVSLKQALGSLELEAAVDELLERNANALKRLEELQNKRLSKPGEFSPVEQGSEEWDTAQSILDSLCLLTTLRPRQSTCDHTPLAPSSSALHRLQRTLLIAPTQGWHGTLPAEHPTALRDDSTLYIKSTATAIPAAPSAPPATTPTPAQPALTPAQTTATATATTQAYAGYPYNYTPYRPGYPYKPGQQPTPYYPNAYSAPTAAQAQATPQYYQGPYGATGQQQYTYSSWYQYNPQTQAGTSAGGSRKGTPQPTTTAAGATATTPATTAPTMPTSYAGFFSATTQTPGPRAVANTVVAATPGGKPYQPPTVGGAWTAPAGGAYASTLPPHMRSAVTGQSGAAGAYNASGLYQPNYYGTYQATPSPSPAQS